MRALANNPIRFPGGWGLQVCGKTLRNPQMCHYGCHHVSHPVQMEKARCVHTDILVNLYLVSPDLM